MTRHSSPRLGEAASRLPPDLGPPAARWEKVMLIVDAQVHIWGANTPERPWPAGRSSPHRPQPFSKDDLLQEMNAAEVARVVIVPPSWEGIATTWRWRRRASIPSASR